MTNKINLIINMSILALLIYLAVTVKELQNKVFTDPNVMTPLSENITEDQFRDAIMNLLIQKLQEIE